MGHSNRERLHAQAHQQDIHSLLVAGGFSWHDIDMEKRMSNVEAIIPTLATKTDLEKGIKAAVDALENKIGEVKEDVEKVKKDVENVRKDVENVRVDVERVRTEIQISSKRTAILLLSTISAATAIIISALTLALALMLPGGTSPTVVYPPQPGMATDVPSSVSLQIAP